MTAGAHRAPALPRRARARRALLRAAVILSALLVLFVATAAGSELRTAALDVPQRLVLVSIVIGLPAVLYVACVALWHTEKGAPRHRSRVPGRRILT